MIQCLHTPSEKYTNVISFYVDIYHPHTCESNIHLYISTVDYVHLAKLLKQRMGICLERYVGSQHRTNSVLTFEFMLKALGSHRNILSRKLQGLDLNFREIILIATWEDGLRERSWGKETWGCWSNLSEKLWEIIQNKATTEEMAEVMAELSSTATGTQANNCKI